MHVLLLIPSVAVEAGAGADRPVMDYNALAAAIRSRDGDSVDLLDYAAVDRDTSFSVRVIRRLAGRDAALAWMGFCRRRQYDVEFTNGENVGIPLAILFSTTIDRPGHVTIGHRLSSGKKRLFFTLFKAHRRIDRILVYATSQLTYAERSLGLPADKLKRIAFHADQRFFRPMPDEPVNDDQVCSAGLEWRDYPTLIEAARGTPDLQVRLAAASPWSKHTNETAGRELPPNVEARRYDYNRLRKLYAQSNFVVVPLYENDFQAGVTTILEAMAMGKAVIVTATTGQTDVIIHGVNGLTVPPGDVVALGRAIEQLRCDDTLRRALETSARAWVEEHSTLDLWVDNVTNALRECARKR